jgi:hypothetical protein
MKMANKYLKCNLNLSRFRITFLNRSAFDPGKHQNHVEVL